MNVQKYEGSIISNSCEKSEKLGRIFYILEPTYKQVCDLHDNKTGSNFVDTCTE
jgi:hypothetical protein